jgi:hypothetical protein
MKARTIILIALTAIVTLSFTFASVNKPSEKKVEVRQSSDEPVGGFAAEDKF